MNSPQQTGKNKSFLRPSQGSNIYDDFSWKSEADTFPAKLDLRDRGIVTPVRNQDPWGSCWSFGTIAACETSILTTLGLTAEEFESKYGVPMDLSEKHLAWFTKNALPELDEYPEGEYPYDVAQAGEGSCPVEGTGVSRYNFGGTFSLATSMLASGVGVVEESIAPEWTSMATGACRRSSALPRAMSSGTPIFCPRRLITGAENMSTAKPRRR